MILSRYGITIYTWTCSRDYVPRQIDAEWNFSWSETSKRSDARLPDQQMLLNLRGKDGRI